MNKRQKHIASCSNPYYKQFASKKEVVEAKKLACGKFWEDKDYGQYCSFTPKGQRNFFGYEVAEHYTDHELQGNVFDFTNELSKLKARKSAELWSKGKCKHARMLCTLTV